LDGIKDYDGDGRTTDKDTNSATDITSCEMAQKEHQTMTYTEKQT
jgi:hypothetical protein